jgi:hypothetical protein
MTQRFFLDLFYFILFYDLTGNALFTRFNNCCINMCVKEQGGVKTY